MHTNEDRLAGLTIFVVSFAGVCLNAVVVFWISTLPSMRNPFGRLSQSQSVADLMNLLVFMLYLAPTVFFDLSTWKKESFSGWFGQLHLIFYEACNLCHLMVSINRLIAIFFPIHYRQFFTIRHATCCSIFAWTFATISCFIAHTVAGCPLVYSGDYWRYNFPAGAQCNNVALYYEYNKNLCLVVLIFFMDLVTFFRCRTMRAKTNANSNRTTTTSIAGNQRRTDEYNFVIQACTQGFLFVVELIFYFQLSPMVSGRTMKFLFTTVTWCAVHTIDGLITIVCNREFKQWRKKPKKSLLVLHFLPSFTSSKSMISSIRSINNVSRLGHNKSNTRQDSSVPTRY